MNGGAFHRSPADLGTYAFPFSAAMLAVELAQGGAPVFFKASFEVQAPRPQFRGAA